MNVDSEEEEQNRLSSHQIGQGEASSIIGRARNARQRKIETVLWRALSRTHRKKGNKTHKILPRPSNRLFSLAKKHTLSDGTVYAIGFIYHMLCSGIDLLRLLCAAFFPRLCLSLCWLYVSIHRIGRNSFSLFYLLTNMFYDFFLRRFRLWRRERETERLPLPKR